MARRGLCLGLGAFFIEDAVLIGGQGTRFVDVGGPFAALGLGELREQLVGEHREGPFGGLSEEQGAKGEEEEGAHGGFGEVWKGLHLTSPRFVNMQLVPQIQKTHRLPESEIQSAGFLNLREIIKPDAPVFSLHPARPVR